MFLVEVTNSENNYRCGYAKVVDSDLYKLFTIDIYENIDISFISGNSLNNINVLNCNIETIEIQKYILHQLFKFDFFNVDRKNDLKHIISGVIDYSLYCLLKTSPNDNYDDIYNNLEIQYSSGVNNHILESSTYLPNIINKKEKKQEININSSAITFKRIESILLDKFDRDDIEDIIAVLREELLKNSPEIKSNKYTSKDLKKTLEKEIYKQYIWPGNVSNI